MKYMVNWKLDGEQDILKIISVGTHIIDKYRQLAKEGSYGTVARNLRKQGYPLRMALIILGVRRID